MANPLLLGTCPDCKGPRKYSTDPGSIKRLWLKCPSPLCKSRPPKINRANRKIIALPTAPHASASRSAH